MLTCSVICTFSTIKAYLSWFRHACQPSSWTCLQINDTQQQYNITTLLKINAPCDPMCYMSVSYIFHTYLIFIQLNNTDTTQTIYVKVKPLDKRHKRDNKIGKNL